MHGKQLEGAHCQVCMHVCDNAAVVATINTNRSKDNQTMHLHTYNKMLNFFLSHHNIINSVNLHHKSAQDRFFLLSLCHIPSANIIIIIAVSDPWYCASSIHVCTSRHNRGVKDCCRRSRKLGVGTKFPLPVKPSKPHLTRVSNCPVADLGGFWRFRPNPPLGCT